MFPAAELDLALQGKGDADLKQGVTRPRPGSEDRKQKLGVAHTWSCRAPVTRHCLASPSHEPGSAESARLASLTHSAVT